MTATWCFPLMMSHNCTWDGQVQRLDIFGGPHLPASPMILLEKPFQTQYCSSERVLDITILKIKYTVITEVELVLLSENSPLRAGTSWGHGLKPRHYHGSSLTGCTLKYFLCTDLSSLHQAGLKLTT